jgi:hypothetical protein
MVLRMLYEASHSRTAVSFFSTVLFFVSLLFLPFETEVHTSVPQSDPNFADRIKHIREPKARMAAVWAFCKTKMICEPDEPKEDEEDGAGDPNVKKGHGGCGHIQPSIRKEGLKLFLHYKKLKDDDEVSAR